MLIVAYVKHLVSLLLLSYASIEDLKRREISDVVWLLFGISAFSINLVSYFIFHTFYISLTSIVYVLLLLAVFLGLYYIGAYGGADAKALICITLMFPFISEEVSLYGLSILPMPLVTFFYASILSLVQVVSNLVHNLLLFLSGIDLFKGINESAIKRVLAIFLLRKERVRKRYLNIFFNPAEKVLEDGSKKIVLFPNLNESSLINEGELMFVSPLMPFVLFLTLGLLLSAILGDSIVVNAIKFIVNLFT